VAQFRRGGDIGLHPLRVESVAWIAERKDVLCLSFWLLSAWAYACYVEREKLRSVNGIIACACCFRIGIDVQPMMVTFPFFLMLLDYWPLKRIQG